MDIAAECEHICDKIIVHYRRTGQFFLGGLSHLCPKNFSTAPQKTAMLTCKITLPDSPHPLTISKNPGFWALYHARQNEFRFFRLINTNFFSFLAAVFCSKNLVFARKIMVCLSLPPWLVHLCCMRPCVLCILQLLAFKPNIVILTQHEIWYAKLYNNCRLDDSLNLMCNCF